MSNREQGTVKWFNDAKGFGFIEREDGEDVFVHYSQIKAGGFRILSAGQLVEFEVFQGEKSLEAGDVVVIKTPHEGTIISLAKEEERGVIKSNDGQMFPFDYSNVWEDIDTLSVRQRVRFNVFQGETQAVDVQVLNETGYLSPFDPKKGYGLIVRDSGGNIFFHVKDIHDENPSTCSPTPRTEGEV